MYIYYFPIISGSCPIGDCIRIIFGYLSYEDLWNSVYKMDGLLGDIATKVMDDKYAFFVHCESLKQFICDVTKEVHPALAIRKDCVLIVNALLMDVMINIIDTLNMKYEGKSKTNSINELNVKDIQSVYAKCNLFGELCEYAYKVATHDILNMEQNKNVSFDFNNVTDIIVEQTIKNMFAM